MSTGTVVLQATILTAASVLGLTLFTFWAVKRGYDFTFTFPFLFTCLVVLLMYITIQVRLPDNNIAFLFLSIDLCSRVTCLAHGLMLIHCRSSSRWEGWP